jgi:radical SAM superfamily enzyme YgiQ (UPF0313 family)
MNFVYVNYTVRDNVFDYAWLSFKSYIEDNYKGSTKWHWPFPINSSIALSPENLANEILSLQPKVVGFSVYVWNVGLSREVARIVKEKNPNVYVVFGGPYSEYKEDADYFRKHPYIDFTCQTDGYGEPFINELLYQIETDNDWLKVPFMVMPDQNGNAVYGEPYPKRSFEWPRKIFERNTDYISWVHKTKVPNLTVMAVYETHRGCPYGCVFCEWSGGINSKVSFKPTELVLEDIRWLIESGSTDIFQFVEANYGQIDRDVEVTEEICRLKAIHGRPYDVAFNGLSKSKKSNVYKINRLLAESGMLIDVKISIQNIDPLVLKNIDRYDEPWEKQIPEHKALQKDFDLKIRAECIRGLPGTTLESYYHEVGELAKHNMFWEKYPWYLLPTSPASNPAYLSKYKIKTIEEYADGSRHTIISADEFVNDTRGLVGNTQFAQKPKIVIGSYSYTPSEYAEMLVSDGIVFAMETEGYLRRLTQYLSSTGVPHSEFYKRFYSQFIHGGYLTDIQFSVLKSIILQAQDKVKAKSTHDFEYFKLEGLPWQLYGKVQALVNVMININREAFYSAVHRWVIDEFGDDEKLSDLIKFCSNSVLWIDHDPTNPVSFKTDYDWTDEEPVYGPVINTPRDKTYSNKNFDIDWHHLDMKDRIAKYFLRLCAINGDDKIFKNIEVMYVD